MNIAYLTSEYRDYRIRSGDTNTYIANSFARAWVRQGHNVVVIHNASCFPKIIYYLPQWVKKMFESKAGFTWGIYETVKKDKYYDENVTIYRLPFRKYIPHKSASGIVLNKQAKQIKKIFEKNGFSPDIIIGQWVSPQLELIYRLRDYYPNCKTGVVLHGDTYIYDKKYPALKYFQKIDRVGTRSEVHADSVMKGLSLKEKPFVCYSGIPDKYVTSYKLNVDKFSEIRKWKFAFVGRLVEYKKADVLIRALCKLENVDWELNVVGDGGQLPALLQLCEQLKCTERVIFHGKVNRDKVMQILSDSHCFAMVSVGEVFGLVYLEAMGACCITVASIGGGIDGVIKNQINGFLSEGGDECCLVDVLNRIISTSEDKLKQIVIQGYNTAESFSETKVAKDFLDKVCSIDRNS